MLQLTRRDLADSWNAARNAHSFIQGYQKDGERVVGQITQTLEVSAGAVGVGILSGRFGALHLAGSPIPLDLAGGLLLHGAGFLGFAGKYGEHLHNFADGVLAGWLTKWGVGLGASMREGAGLPRVPVTAGQLPSAPTHAPMTGASSRTNHTTGCGAPLTEAELAAMSHGVR